MPIKVHREQIVMIDPGVELGAVPVFSDLVSLQYVRPDVRGRSSSATVTWPNWRSPTPTRTLNRATESSST